MSVRFLLLWTVAVSLYVYAASACSQQRPQDTATPELDTTTAKYVPYDDEPKFKDREEAVRSVEQHYPKDLKDAGYGARVVLYVFVDVDGRVKNTKIYRSSGNDAFDQAAMAAAREFEFIPARLKGNIVPVWITLPITFSVSRR